MLALVPALCLAAPAAASASVGGFAGVGHTSSDGWIRLTHLSPNTPAVDVYLYSFGDSNAMIVLHHVSYGTVSPYERVPVGEYSVAMRAAGAAAGSTPVLSTSVQVQAGHAYTVAGLGPESGLRLAILEDRLTTPSGRSLVRVIQASLKQHVVTVTFGGHTLAQNLAFASVSSYHTVSPGTETVRVTAGGAVTTSSGSGASGASAGSAGVASRSISLDAKTVHTLVVLDGANGLEIEDAAGNNAVPAGGVSTGFGGMARAMAGGANGASAASGGGAAAAAPWLVLAAAGAGLAVAAALRLRRLSAPRPGRRP
jgi:hypothetical protein